MAVMRRSSTSSCLSSSRLIAMMLVTTAVVVMTSLCGGLAEAAEVIPDVSTSPLIQSGSYAVGQRVVTIPRSWTAAGYNPACLTNNGLMCGGTFDVMVTYPTYGTPKNTSDMFLGLDVPKDDTAPPLLPSSISGGYPVVSWGIGWMSWANRYSYTHALWASHGIITVSPMSTDRALVPDFELLFRDMLSALSWAAADKNSFLYDKTNTKKYAVAGHSSGGGAAMGAAATYERNKARAPFTLDALLVWGITPVGLPPEANLAKTPGLFLSGEKDVLVPVEWHRSIFDTLNREMPRVHIVGELMTHCFLDVEAWGPSGVQWPASDCDIASVEPTPLAAPDWFQDVVAAGMGTGLRLNPMANLGEYARVGKQLEWTRELSTRFLKARLLDSTGGNSQIAMTNADGDAWILPAMRDARTYDAKTLGPMERGVPVAKGEKVAGGGSAQSAMSTTLAAFSAFRGLAPLLAPLNAASAAVVQPEERVAGERVSPAAAIAG
ncbi:chlorophyllase [Pycnococcus provasolii]